MPKQFSPLAPSLAFSGGGAWAATPPSARGDFIDLTVADSDLTPPEDVVARAVAALRAGDSRYPAIAGRAHVRQLIAESSGRRAGAENVLLAPGAQGALYLAMRCIAGPGDRVLTIEPYYLNYPATLAATGAAVDTIGVDPDDDFLVTEAAVVGALTRNTKAIVLSNPNNPTGRFLSYAEMHMLSSVARRHDLWIVCDEVYRELCFEAQPRASWSSVDDRLVTLSSLSKTHAMSGWRFGWMVAPTRLIAQATQLADVVFHGVPGFIQEAAAVALADDGAAARNATALHRRRRDVFADRLSVSPIKVLLPQAGLFALCDVRRTGLGGAQFAAAALAEAGLGVVGGGRFGAATAGFVRVALTADEDVLIEAADRIAKLARRVSDRLPAATTVKSTPPAPSSLFADGVYISPSGDVHVCSDGNLEGIF